jgi:hypothetical protein
MGEIRAYWSRREQSLTILTLHGQLAALPCMIGEVLHLPVRVVDQARRLSRVVALSKRIISALPHTRHLRAF